MACTVVLGTVGVPPVFGRETTSKPKEIDQRYEEGKRLLEEGRYEEASEAFRQITSAPAVEVADNSPASNSHEVGSLGTAEPSGFLRKRLSQWHAEQAQLALTRHEYLAALTHAQRALELDPSDRQAKQLAGQAKRAFEDEKRRLAKKTALVEQAQRAEQQGQERRAAALWKKVDELNPGDPQAREAIDRLQARWSAMHPPIKRAVELTQTATPRSLAQEYRITIGDVLEVFVWQQPDLSRDVVVRPDGRISFPLVGTVDAVNLTLTQLTDTLTQKLKTYIKYPDVSLAIKRFGGIKTIVLGEVGRSGIYVPTGEGRALDVIAMAGGFAPEANLKDVLLVRGGLASPQLARLDLERALTRGALQENVVLQPNDILYIAKRGKGTLTTVMDVVNQLSPILSDTLVFQTVATNFGAREFQRTGRSTGVK